MTGFSNSKSIIELASVLLTGTNSLFALTIIRPFGNKSLVFIVGILVTTKMHTLTNWQPLNPNAALQSRKAKCEFDFMYLSMLPV